VSPGPEKTRIRPRFSATKILPSGAKRKVVDSRRPSRTTRSLKNAGQLTLLLRPEGDNESGDGEPENDEKQRTRREPRHVWQSTRETGPVPPEYDQLVRAHSPGTLP